MISTGPLWEFTHTVVLSTELGKNPGYVLPKRGRKQDGTGQLGIDVTGSNPLAVESGASDDGISCEAEHDDEEDDEEEDEENGDEEDDDEDDLRPLQIRIEDEPAWIRLVDGDRLYCSKIEPQLSVLFELVPLTMAPTKVETDAGAGCGSALSADEQQPGQQLLDREQPADWRLKLPARGSLRLQQTATDAHDECTSVEKVRRHPTSATDGCQHLGQLNNTQPPDWRLKLPARGSLRLQ